MNSGSCSQMSSSWKLPIKIVHICLQLFTKATQHCRKGGSGSKPQL